MTDYAAISRRVTNSQDPYTASLQRSLGTLRLEIETRIEQTHKLQSHVCSLELYRRASRSLRGLLGLTETPLGEIGHRLLLDFAEQSLARSASDSAHAGELRSAILAMPAWHQDLSEDPDVYRTMLTQAEQRRDECQTLVALVEREIARIENSRGVATVLGKLPAPTFNAVVDLVRAGTTTPTFESNKHRLVSALRERTSLNVPQCETVATILRTATECDPVGDARHCEPFEGALATLGRLNTDKLVSVIELVGEK